MKDENMNIINKAWQLCVIDRFRADFSNAPHFENLVKNDAKTSKLADGTIVFIVNSMVKPFTSLSSAYNELRNSNHFPAYSILNGIPFAYVWQPNNKKYATVLHEFLRPILTEQDAVEMEFKFGIDLKMFI